MRSPFPCESPTRVIGCTMTDDPTPGLDPAHPIDAILLGIAEGKAEGDQSMYGDRVIPPLRPVFSGGGGAKEEGSRRWG